MEWQKYAVGSPPHTRGRRYSKCSLTRLRDHPRTRRDTQRDIWERGGTGITPAHAGKTGRLRHTCDEDGITPAHAGKSFPGLFFRLLLRITPAHAGKYGSDARGTTLLWITPAHAGNTSPPFYPGAPGSPPHTRGYLQGFHRVGRLQGSPPHTRGKSPEGRHCYHEAGITPAHAGNTPWAKLRLHGRDHPRTRGEKFSQLVAVFIGGITPAHAGKTPSCQHIMEGLWDHPRTRGENCRSFFLTLCGDHPRTRGAIPRLLSKLGSPPHTRGIPSFLVLRHTHKGSPPHTRGY